MIERIESVALQPGQHAVLTVHGKALKNVRRLCLPFVTMLPKEGHDPAADTLVVFEADIPADTPPQVYPANVTTDQGTSAAQLVIVESVPVVALTAESEVVATPQLLPLPCSVTGQLNAVKPRFFKVNLMAGQTVNVEVFARRLSSDLDPVLRITSPAGTEVAFCDDVPGMQGDALARVTAEMAGDYTIELRDVRYSGGARHAFHLRVGEIPPNEFSVAMPFLAGDAVTLQEAEPNDTQETATPVPADVKGLSGKLQSPGDADWFVLTADAPGSLCVTAHTRDAGSPADVTLQLWSADGKKLAEADDVAPLDAQLVASLPAAGSYLLRVAELAGRGGEEWDYVLEVDRGTGRVELTLSSDRVNVPRGGSASLAATVKRIQFDGPLLLQADDLPAAFTMQPILAGSRQSTLMITLSASAMSYEDALAEMGPLKLRLTAADPAVPLTVLSRTAPPPAKNKADEPFRSILARADVFTAVRPAAQFSITSEPTTLVVKRGASASVTLQAARHQDWPMPIDVAAVTPDQLLPGLTVPAVKLEGETGQLTITAAADAGLGKCTVFVQGTATKEKETVTQPIAPIVVEVVE